MGSYPLSCPLNRVSFHLYYFFYIVSKPRILKESFWQWHVPLLFPDYLTQIHSSKLPQPANSCPYHHLQLIWPKYSASTPLYHVCHFLPTHLLGLVVHNPQYVWHPVTHSIATWHSQYLETLHLCSPHLGNSKKRVFSLRMGSNCTCLRYPLLETLFF